MQTCRFSFLSHEQSKRTRTQKGTETSRFGKSHKQSKIKRNKSYQAIETYRF